MTNLSGYMGLHISELVKQIEKYEGQICPVCRRRSASAQRFLKIELRERCSFMPFHTPADGGTRRTDGTYAACGRREHGLR